MRILHLINHCELANGNVHMAVDLASAQARNGDDVTVASAGGYFLEYLERQGVRHINVSQNLRNPVVGIVALARVLTICRELRPDVIHAHMMSGAIIGLCVSKLVRRPLVTTVHNSFDKHSKYMALADTAVAVSQVEYDNLVAVGFPKSRLAMVLNGPLGSLRYPREPSVYKDPGNNRIISICGLHPRKGVGDTLKAFALIAEKFPNWNLIVAGEGPDEEGLREQARSLGIAARVDFRGKVKEPFETLAQGDIFVIASHAEPFGIAAVEARSAGCAVVASNVGGLPEVLEHGAAGLLVEPGKPERLAEAFTSLIEDPALRKRLQLRATENLEPFTVTRMTAGYGEIYNRLAARYGVVKSVSRLKRSTPSVSR